MTSVLGALCPVCSSRCPISVLHEQPLPSCSQVSDGVLFAMKGSTNITMLNMESKTQRDSGNFSGNTLSRREIEIAVGSPDSKSKLQLGHL